MSHTATITLFCFFAESIFYLYVIILATLYHLRMSNSSRLDPLRESGDPAKMAFLGISNHLNIDRTNSTDRQIYYRDFLVGPGLTSTVTKTGITLDVAGGAGTVTDVNGLTGSVTVSNGDDINVTLASDIRINVISDSSATPNTIPKRRANGTFDAATPSLADNVATKAYVDAVAMSLTIFEPVRTVQTTSFGTIAGATGGGVDVVASGAGPGKTLTNDGVQAQLVVDSVTMVNGDRVLVTGDGVHNGIYDVTDQGSGASNWILTRSTDADDLTGELVSGTYVYISEGTVNTANGFVLTTADPITVDTTVTVWSIFNSAGQVTASNVGAAGVGIFKQKTGNTLEFHTINAASTKVIIVDDTVANNEIDIDVNETQLSLNNMQGPLFPSKGGTGLTFANSNTFIVGNGLGSFLHTKQVPTGDVIGTTDTQTFTNKTIIDSSNTVAASEMQTTTTNVNVSASAAPTVGQILTATSGTTATWQDQTSLLGTTTTTQTGLGFNVTVAIGNNTVAVGDNSTSTGVNSIAVGPSSSATQSESIALGRLATSSHARAIALGNTTTDAVDQLKVANTIASLRMVGLTDVGDGQIVCHNASGDIGPNTSGAVILPALAVDPAVVNGGFYYNTATNKVRASDGAVWNELEMNSKTSVTGMNLAGSPNTIRSFADTTYKASNWRYVLTSQDGLNFRAGEVMAVWNAATDAVTFQERTTQDLGDTSAVTLSVAIVANNVIWRATITGAATWDIDFYEEGL